MLIKHGTVANAINAQNLIAVLKEFYSKVKLNNTQWKIIVSIADREKNNIIDFDLFMNLVESSTKKQVSHPRPTSG